MSRFSFFTLCLALAVFAARAAAQVIVLTPSTTTINPAGGTLTFTATVTYSGAPSVLAFSATLPTGWTYQGGTNEPTLVRPSTGSTGTLSWVYDNAPASPATFTFNATYPANLTGLQPLATSSVTRATVEAPAVTTAGPTVTLSAPPRAYTWAGDSETRTGNWTDATRWTANNGFPLNAGLATYSAEISLGTASIPTGTTILLNDLLLLGGNVNGGGALKLFGPNSSWTGGAMSGLDQVLVSTGATLTASTYAAHDFDQTTILNQGTFSWQQGGALRSGNGGAFINAAGATFIDASSGTVQDYLITNSFGGAFAFSNLGTYRKVTAGSNTRIEVPFTNSGALLIDGGLLRFTSTYTQSGGNLRLATGTTATFDNPVAFSSGSVIGNGTLTGNITNGTGVSAPTSAPGVSAATVIETAVLSPGDTLGRLNIQGNLTLLSTSKLIVDIAGSTQGVDYDFLSISGNATLGGALSVNVTEAFRGTISPAATFTVVTAANVTGAFTNAAPGARFWANDLQSSFVVNYTTTGVTLTNFQIVPIPEPSTWALMIAGLGVIAVSLWRKRK